MTDKYVKSDIYEGLVFDGLKRYYVEDLTKRNFTLENTTPHEITIFGNTVVEHSWGIMLVKVVDLLIENQPKSKEDLLNFRVTWTKTAMFSESKKTNHRILKNGLYLNCNHTAQHSCWLIQDILDFFGLDKSDVYFLIHRSPKAEPKSVRELLKTETKENFKKYLCEVCSKTEDEAEQLINILDGDLNKVLSKISPSYNDFFLFDEYPYAYNYYKKTKEYLEARMQLKDRAHLIESLDSLIAFYKTLKA